MKRRIIFVAVAWAAWLTACGYDSAGSSGKPVRGPDRSIKELQGVEHHPRACAATDDCPTGSHCDEETGTCAWSCLANDECGAGNWCDLLGECAPSPNIGVSSRVFGDACVDSEDGHPLTPAEKYTILLALNDDNVSCDMENQSADCPCGSYCGTDGFCKVDCLSGAAAPPGHGCTQPDTTCSPLGKCTASPPPPPPPLALTIDLGNGLAIANTVGGPLLVPVTVKVVADNIAVIDPNNPNPAVIDFSFPEQTEFDRGVTDESPGVMPRVKCSPTGTLGKTCALTGGWTFNVAGGLLVSDAKTVWVEIPQMATEDTWSLRAASDWSDTPAYKTVVAAPVTYPTSDPGHYKGKMTWANRGAVLADDQNLSVPIEAIVTATRVVLFEPSRLMFPDGHVVLRRPSLAPSQSTLMYWLDSPVTSGTHQHYLVRLDLGAASYNPATGHLDTTVELRPSANDVMSLSVALDYVDGLDVAAPTCPAHTCAAGSYCDSSVGRCLAGTGPAPGPGLVPTAVAIPSAELRSETVQTWAGPVRTVADGSTLLAGTGAAGLVRGYCYKASDQQSDDSLSATTFEPNSQDRQCRATGVVSDYAQQTFPYVNTDHEYTKGTTPSDTYDLFARCESELGMQPPTNPDLSNLFPADPGCVSLARFFTAMTANLDGSGGVPLNDTGQRLVHQLVRQWLGVNAYYASTAIRSRLYDDVLSGSTELANERLGRAIDRVDSGLRVLLDPRIRPQYATGVDLSKVVNAPDYRVGPRPLVRWAFNGATPAVANDGNNQLTGNQLYVDSTMRCDNTGAMSSTQAPVFSATADDRRFTITLYPVARTYPVFLNNPTFTLFDKLAPNGDRVWIEARMDGGGSLTPSFTLTLKDSGGAVVTFDPMVDDRRDPLWGFLAIVVDNGTYRLYRYNTAGQVLQYTGHPANSNVVRWRSPGNLHLQCSLPHSFVCNSWDMYLDNDKLAAPWFQSFSETPTFGYSCGGTCTGLPPVQASCNTRGAERRTQLVSQATGLGAPTSAANQIALAVDPINITSFTEEEDRERHIIIRRWSYQCPYAITQYPIRSNTSKPVCGGPSPGPYTQNGFEYDEFSVWDRVVSLDEFTRMATRRGWTPANDALPPETVPGGACTTAGDGTVSCQEQATGLPAHLLEAAAADLELLGQYIDSERGVIFSDCTGAHDLTSRNRTTGRAAKNLRLVELLAVQAEALAGLPGASSSLWYPRFVAARNRLAGLRQRTLKLLHLAATCSNPLDIPDDQLPLYVGQAVDITSRFFASSRHLTSLAQSEIGQANALVNLARDAYLRERQEKIAFAATRDAKSVRVANLRANYESQIRRLCGTPGGSTTSLLTGFLSGAITIDTCFFKTAAEDADCAGVAAKPIPEVLAKCVRGQLGERLIAIQTALIDLKNAKAAATRAQTRYDGDHGFCDEKKRELADIYDNVIKAHFEHMQALRARNEGMDRLIAGPIEAAFSKNWTQMRLGLTDLWDNREHLNWDIGAMLEGDFEQGFPLAEREQRAQEAYEADLALRNQGLALADCYHQAENAKFAIDDAHDAEYRVQQQVTVAATGLEAEANQLVGLIDEARGQIEVENRISGTPPQFHYWLDQTIADYHRHMTYARRLTYLAVRALEYEAQQSTNLRAGVFAARRPEDLITVCTAVNTWNTETSGGIGRVLEPQPVVLSLRDEILGMKALGQHSNKTPEEVFQAFLASDAAKLYADDPAKTYLGRGIRFSITPDSWVGADDACAERIWRLNNSLQMSNPPNQHQIELYKENSFGSQTCRDHSGDVIVSNANPAVNVLSGDASAFASKKPYLSMTVDGPPGQDHHNLRILAESNFSGFAGRGLYGNYILIFRPGPWPDAQPWSNAPLSRVTDVLLRFDIVNANNAPSPAAQQH